MTKKTGREIIMAGSENISVVFMGAVLLGFLLFTSPKQAVAGDDCAEANTATQDVLEDCRSDYSYLYCDTEAECEALCGSSTCMDPCWGAEVGLATTQAICLAIDGYHGIVEVIEEIISVGGEVIGSIWDAFEDIWDFFFADSNKFRDTSDPLILFEGNDCTEASVGSLPLEDFSQNFTEDDAHFDNDEARSLYIVPNQAVIDGTTVELYSFPEEANVALYDDSSGSTSDDYVVIYFNSAPPADGYCIGSFETSYSDDYVNVEYYSDDGLDGKVSYVEVDGGVMSEVKEEEETEEEEAEAEEEEIPVETDPDWGFEPEHVFTDGDSDYHLGSSGDMDLTSYYLQSGSYLMAQTDDSIIASDFVIESGATATFNSTSGSVVLSPFFWVERGAEFHVY